MPRRKKTEPAESLDATLPVAADPRPNTEDNQPETVEVDEGETRSIEITEATRNTLALLATWMRLHQHRSEYGDVAALDTVVAAYDGDTEDEDA